MVAAWARDISMLAPLLPPSSPDRLLPSADDILCERPDSSLMDPVKVNAALLLSPLGDKEEEEPPLPDPGLELIPPIRTWIIKNKCHFLSCYRLAKGWRQWVQKTNGICQRQ